jgi:DNA modification methylase
MNTCRKRVPAKDASPDIQQILRHNVRLDRISYVAIDQLRTYERSLRKRKNGGAEALKNSVSSFGIVLPVLIDSKMTIIGGEGIVATARDLGYTEVPTVRIDHLDDAEVRMLRIALNKLAETSEWNRIELAAEFAELVTLDIDLAYEVTGFDTVEIDNLVHAPAEPDGEDPDDLPILPGLPGSEVTRLGDIWELGDHRLLCGSSLEMDNLARLMGDDRARMVLTDSPFNVKISGHVSGLGKTKHREFAQASGEMSEAEFIEFQSTSTRTLAAYCIDGALLYLYMDWRHVWEIMSGIRAAGLTLFNLAVWVKRAGGMGSFYRSQHELVFIAKKGKTSHINNVQLGRFGRNRTNCWHYAGMNSFGAGRDELLAAHPTVKPVAMLSDAIRDASHRGDIVLDGFLGSGSTLIAAERTGRVCRGVELDPLYVDSIVRRWEKATGRVATLFPGGETFAQVAARREAEAIDTVGSATAAPARPDVAPRSRTRVPA